MNQRLFEIALQRERLIERIAGQRARLAASSDGIRALCADGDRLIAVTRKLRDNPQWVMLATFGLVLIRPRRAWRWLRTGVFVWRAWVAVRRRLPGLAGR